ncbi:MAG: hypothetical protein WB615_04950 [Candidatus Tumulicola sp.]
MRVPITAASAALAASVILPGGPARAVTVSPQVRHLMYSFTWGTQTSREVMTSGINGGDPKKESGSSGNSGVADFTGSIGDQGTVRVDIVSQQADKGVVIKVSEQAQKTRSAPPATCVVYPTTGVICDPNVTVNPEEMALIRFLAPTFVDPDSLDAARHWEIENATPQYSLVSNFTIAKNENGIMTIDENRVIKQQRPEVSTISANTTIGYDFGRSVPTSINEYTIERSQGLACYGSSRDPGSVVEYAPGSGTPLRTLTDGIDTPIAMTTGRLGLLFVANHPFLKQGSITVYASGTAPVRMITDGINGPDSLAVDRDGYLYVANWCGCGEKEDSITVYSPDGSRLLRTISQGVQGPTAIAIGEK